MRPYSLKTKIALVVGSVVLLVIVLAFFNLRKSILPSNQSPGMEDSFFGHKQGPDMIVSGTVVKNYKALDSEYSITLQLENQIKTMRVIYSYAGPPNPPALPECINGDAYRDGISVKEGDRVEIFGKIVEDGTLSICDAQKYYIKRLLAR